MGTVSLSLHLRVVPAVPQIYDDVSRIPLARHAQISLYKPTGEAAAATENEPSQEALIVALRRFVSTVKGIVMLCCGPGVNWTDALREWTLQAASVTIRSNCAEPCSLDQLLLSLPPLLRLRRLSVKRSKSQPFLLHALNSYRLPPIGLQKTRLAHSSLPFARPRELCAPRRELRELRELCVWTDRASLIELASLLSVRLCWPNMWSRGPARSTDWTCKTC
ncbi:hypothetical protein V5799_004297 [Amblyomma americanum]|uniref:Uncharacterized protein n=1 Tax=Amblyomma americanum TaxID=6943 RepID=A0AAQ4D6I3_AMBAM